VAGALSDKFGRKKLLVLAALLFAVTSLGNALADNFTIFIAWRMLGGVTIGLASNLSPMYIAKVAPAPIRGRLVSINQLTIVVGILLAQSINWFRVLPADLHVSAVERHTRLNRDVLALRCDLRGGIYFHLLQAAGDEGQNTGAA